MDNADIIGEMMFSNGSVESFSDAKPEVLIPMEEKSALKDCQQRAFAFDTEGNRIVR